MIRWLRNLRAPVEPSPEMAAALKRLEIALDELAAVGRRAAMLRAKIAYRNRDVLHD